jgi:N-acetylglutamate synthase-like GNAT family acetyltransferase
MQENNIRIRSAQPSDWKSIEEMLRKYWLDAQDASWEKFFVAEGGGKVLGCGRIIDHTHYLEVASLGVNYYHRKKGIGTLILRFLIEEARKMSPDKGIYLVTHRPGFFRRVGFRPLTENIPEDLEYKRQHKCRIGPDKIKIMKLE